MKKLFVILFCAMLLCSCGLRKKVLVYGNYPPTNNVEIINHGEIIPDGLEKIGMVNVTDTGFTLSCNCTYTACIKAIRKKAMEMGGDYVYIVDIAAPDGWITCYRIAADVYRKKQQ